MLTHGFDRTIDEEIIDYVAMANDLKMTPATFFRNFAVILAGDEWHMVGDEDWNDVRDILSGQPELLICFESYISGRMNVVPTNGQGDTWQAIGHILDC